MRVLCIVTGAEFGGASRHVLALLSYLLGQGHQVGLVCAPEPRILRESAESGVKVYRNEHFVRPVRLQKDLRALIPVWRAIRDFRPDLVTAHSTKAGFAARLCCALLGVKRVTFTAHGWAFTEGKSRWKRYLLALAERAAAKVTSKIICVSEHDRNLALRFKVGQPEQLAVVHYGIDPVAFTGADGCKIRNLLGMDGRPTVTMVGRLVPQKDPLTLLRACALVRKRFNALLVGDGILRSSAEEFLSAQDGLRNRVRLLGEREDINEILAASHIFVLSSRWEGLPIGVIEAMFSGLPVVATNVGGMAELVEDGATGILVSPGDPAALAGALERLIGDEALRRKMGEAGRRKAFAEFTVGQMLRATEGVYQEVLGRRGREEAGAHGLLPGTGTGKGNWSG